jgi:hypothetical protein
MTTKYLVQESAIGPLEGEGWKADTFFFEDLELFKDMGVCRDCGGIHGLVRLKGGGRFHHQTCGCEDRRGTPQAYEGLTKDLCLDFAQAVTLCSCCGQALVKSGSKFSHFFCNSCREMIVNFNKSQGFFLIPIGRHSLMNQLSLNGKDIQDPKAISKFTEATNSMFKRIDLLREWKKRVMGKNLRKIGHVKNRDINLLSYLNELRPDFWSRFAAFYSIRKHFLSQCRAVPEKAGLPAGAAIGDAGQKPREQDYPEFTAEEAIYCVVYIIVARNQALENKWPGELKAYLRKYGRPYNDKITVNCAMSSGLKKQLVELADNGLDMTEDFTVFEACGDKSVKDGAPCQTHADWLGGCFNDGRVMVFMKQ